MSITWLIVSITRLDQISSKIWRIVCQFFSNPVLRVFSEYIFAVMADKSDEEIQMEGFTSDSDNRHCESIIWPNGMF
jgi:hypothetical protein